MSRCAWMALCLLVAPAFAHAQQNLVTNGSFESGVAIPTRDITLVAGSTDITDWAITGQSIDYLGPPWDVSDGVRAVDLDGRDATFSGVSQSFATAAGKTYVVTFDLSGNPGGAPTIKQLRVTVDGVTQDYTFDTTGQTVEALTWQTVSLPFVASSSSATLAFMSLSATPNSYGPMIDNVRVFEVIDHCVHAFQSGSGDGFLGYCVSDNGTLVRLQSPAAQEHINVGQVWEGYVVCSGSTVQAFDLTTSEQGFGTPSVIGGSSADIAIRRIGGGYQLDQAFKLDDKARELTITMTLSNVSGAPIPDVRLARSYDPDVNGDAGDDVEAKSQRTVWASDADAITLSAASADIPTDAAIDTTPAAACSPAGNTPSVITGDSALATVTYRLGDMAPRAKKRVVFLYRAQ